MRGTLLQVCRRASQASLDLSLTRTTHYTTHYSYKHVGCELSECVDRRPHRRPEKRSSPYPSHANTSSSVIFTSTDIMSVCLGLKSQPAPTLRSALLAGHNLLGRPPS